MAVEERTELGALPKLKSRLAAWLDGAASPVASPEAEGQEEGGLPVRRWELAAYMGLIVVALGMRLWDLGSRALHHDESLHAFYSWNLYAGNGYQHNPMMHGPFQFQINALIFFVFGDSDFTARLLYAVMGTVLVGLPFFLRSRLGRLGGIFTSVMLAFSPVMLYFSRFARNDILMAVWALGLVACMWRYMDEGRNRYLYIAGALLALAFATKETAYLLTVTLGGFLALLVGLPILARVRDRAETYGVSPPVALWRIAAATWSTARDEIKLSELPRPGVFLLLLVTLTLPQWSALVGLLQDTRLLGWSNLVLANPDGVHPIGAPSGGGIIIAAIVVIAMLSLSIYWGYKWDWRVWWRSAAVFYAIWVLLYSTFFTNIVGIGSGVWQSLGYWVAQQDVARGGQPWYYYFIITPLYEFLPLIFAVVAAWFYLRRRDVFGLFLVFWAAATFVLYTAASEKMPWLLVNVALPLIVLSGRFLGEIIGRIDWQRVRAGDGWFLLPGVPALGGLLWWLAFFEPGDNAAVSYAALLVVGALVLVTAFAGLQMARRIGTPSFAAFAAIPIALGLLGLTVRSGAIAAYSHGDIPMEMLVYTQTSPDVPRLYREIERVGGTETQLAVDQTSGFTWPWAWYLRDYKRASYPSYSGSTIETPNASVVIVHSQNRVKAENALAQGFTRGELVRHRWWFPENTYRNLTLGKFLKSFADRDSWRSAMGVFLYREGIRERIGSEDSYVFFADGFPAQYTASR